MKRSFNKWIITSMIGILTLSGAAAYAATPEQKPLPTSPVVEPSTVAPSAGTIFLNGAKDIKITFNEKMEVTGIFQWDQQGSTLDALKGKPLAAVLTEIKETLAPAAGSSKLPMLIGMGADIKGSTQIEEISKALASTFKTQAMISLNLDDAGTVKANALGGSYMMGAYQAHLESVLGMKGLTKEQFETFLQNEKLMSMISQDHAGIAFKKAGEAGFDPLAPNPTQPSTNNDDEDDDDDEEEDDDDDDDDEEEDDEEEDEDDEEDEE